MNYIFENIDEITYTDTQKESVFKKTVFAVLYIWMYQYIHTHYLSGIWGYLGYLNNGIDFSNVILFYIIGLIPIYFYSGLIKISSYFSILIYLLVYIPIVVTLSYNNTDILGFEKVLYYQVLLAIGMIFFFVADKIPIIRTKNLSFNFSMNWFHLFTLIVSVYLLVLFSGNIRLVGFDDAYQLRSENYEASDTISAYFTMWATYLIYPVYFSLGLVKNSKKYLFFGVLGHILIYMIMGTKASLVMPIVLLFFYFLLSKKWKLSFFQILSLSVVLFTFLIYIGGDYLFILGSLFIVRTLSMPGLLFSQYMSFFDSNPNTHYSHIGIINSLTNAYPYGDEPLGMVVGWGIYNNGTNANANFWATDGVAANGLAGIILISLIVFAFLVFLNNFYNNKRSLLFILVSTGPIFSLLNASFFTTLVSGGLLLMIFFFILFNPFEQKTVE